MIFPHGVRNNTTTAFSSQRRSAPVVRTAAATKMWAVTMSFLVVIVTAAMAREEGIDEEFQSRFRRASAKPWLMREFLLLEFPTGMYGKIAEFMHSQGYERFTPSQRIFISPISIILVTLIVVNTWSFISYHLSGSWVEASHILVKDTSPKTLKALVSLKDQLGSNGKLFGQTAKQYSQCPSSQQLGDLGMFGPGTMAPPFDKVCFDSSTPLNTCIGPIQTQFGYHLIYIRKRKL